VVQEDRKLTKKLHIWSERLEVLENDGNDDDRRWGRRSQLARLGASRQVCVDGEDHEKESKLQSISLELGEARMAVIRGGHRARVSGACSEEERERGEVLGFSGGGIGASYRRPRAAEGGGAHLGAGDGVDADTHLLPVTGG
jgi:hypothetical protein